MTGLAPSRCGRHTETAGVEGPHVEDVDALHLSEDLEALETGGLLDVGGDGTGLSARGEQVVHGLDLCVPSDQRLASCLQACAEVAAKCFALLCAQSRTVELLVAGENAGGVGGVAGLLPVGGLGLRVACWEVNGVLVGSFAGGVPYGAQRWW